MLFCKYTYISVTQFFEQPITSQGGKFLGSRLNELSTDNFFYSSIAIIDKNSFELPAKQQLCSAPKAMEAHSKLF